MENFGKIFGINMGVMIVYMVGIHFLAKGGGNNSSDAALGVAILCMIAVAAHAVVDLILMIVMFASGKKGNGFSFLLTTFLVGLIGFGACWGNIASVDYFG